MQYIYVYKLGERCSAYKFILVITYIRFLCVKGSNSFFMFLFSCAVIELRLFDYNCSSIDELLCVNIDAIPYLLYITSLFTTCFLCIFL